MESKNIYNSWRKTLYIICVFFIVSTVYAIVRYHILKQVSWTQFPVFIFNKIISLTALMSLSASYFLGPLGYFLGKNWQGLRKNLGLLGFALVVVHILLSFPIFTPVYFKSFFYKQKLNLYGGLTILLGTLAFFVFAIVAICSIPSVAKSMAKREWLTMQRLGYMGLLLTMGHVLARGNIGWLQPQTWPGGLIPISMVAFIMAAIAVIAKIITIVLSHYKNND